MLDLKGLARGTVAPHPQPLPPRGRGAGRPGPLPPRGGGPGWGGPARRSCPAIAAAAHPPPAARRCTILRGATAPTGRRAPGVVLALRHPVSIVGVIARKGKAQATCRGDGDAFRPRLPAGRAVPVERRLALHWCGFEQWYAVADGFADGALYEDLRDRLAGLASVSDQSHGRVILHIEGPRARDVLAKGTASISTRAPSGRAAPPSPRWPTSASTSPRSGRTPSSCPCSAALPRASGNGSPRCRTSSATRFPVVIVGLGSPLAFLLASGRSTRGAAVRRLPVRGRRGG
jgi:sarcosine oxidase gamma subunit